MTPSRFKPANPYLHTEANERIAKLSSNGKWLAYMSDESNRYEVYIRTSQTPAVNGKFRSMAVANPCGAGMERSYTLSARTKR
jgi:hypothetical protein